MKNREDFQEYIEAFLKQNSYLNLISKNDEKFLWEKHIFDSLAIEKFFEKYFSEGWRAGGMDVRLFNNSSLSEATQEQQNDKLAYPPLGGGSKSLISGWGNVSENNFSTIQPFNFSTNTFPPPQPSPSRGEGACVDSLSTIQPFNLSTNNNFQLLDIGTGGGFPAVPIAITYPEIEVFALDSIRKKINAIENIKAELGLKNLHTICDRAENIASEGWKARGLEDWQFNKISLSNNSHGQKADNSHTSIPPYLQTSDIEKFPYPSCFDLITSRAVAPIKVILEYAMPLLKDDGYFIAYKSIKAQEEIDDAQKVLKKHKAKVVDIIRYDLPLDENFTRNLVVIARN